MPSKLSEPVEDKVREYIVNNITPSEIEGYDPTQSDTTKSDFILVTSDNDNYGDYYPMIFVSENTGPTLPNSGNTNANGMQGDGSGSNQYAIFDVQIQVQAVEGGPYRNSVSYDGLVATIYSELHDILDGEIQLDPGVRMQRLTPPTQTRSSDEADSGSTETWIQRSGTVPVHVHFTP